MGSHGHTKPCPRATPLLFGMHPCFPFIPQPRSPILILLSMLSIHPSHNATPLLSSTHPTNPTPNLPLPSTEKFPVAYIKQ